PGHDRRYALDCSKLNSLGFKSRRTFEEALLQTVRWYQENQKWWRKIKEGEYREYYKKAYGTGVSH
ncbi:MAG: dTDP-glucose 4,6-dehydratase, partial [Nitrospira sp.]|nr:dTDP-glucose 4,6-dehydratase [Nitrospira sp.]